MSKKVPEYLNYFLYDCLDWDKRYSTKSMFWWYAIYKDAKVFSIFVDDIIFFKVWDNNWNDYEKYNSKPFTYTKKSGIVWVMSYYELPEDILENRDELEVWIEKSLQVESKTKSKTKSKKDIDLDKNILEYLLKIPKWKVTTYKILWDKFGVHPRRIASVMRYNKNPEIYPCYKVVSNSLDVSGYSAYDWVDTKIYLLEKDWVKIVDGKVLIDCVFW